MAFIQPIALTNQVMPTGGAFERLGAAIFDDKESGNQAMSRGGHKIGSGSEADCTRAAILAVITEDIGVRTGASTDQHGARVDTDAGGEARMGRRFIEGLSVVDASIIPVIPRANTHLTAVLIAERAASFLIS